MPNAILILAEQLRGKLSDVTYEMLGAGRVLADTLQSPLYVALLGSEAVPLASELRLADKTFTVDSPELNLFPVGPVASVLKGLIDRQGVDLVLVGGTNVSMGIGSVLAARSELPYVNYCRQIRVVEGAVVLTSQLFGGKILADVRLPHNRGIISVYPGAFPADAGRAGEPPVTEPIDVAVEPSAVTFKSYIEPDTGDVDITKESVLVAVGRGVQSQDSVVLAEDLAKALGGAVCASRPVIDQGWLPLSRQVGKSGMIVKPRVYLAFGISGAPEHWEGMQGSETIIAFNTDPDAPIFDGAQFGVCGDAVEYLEILTEKVKERKG